MSVFALSRLEHLYTQVEGTFGVIPNTTGTATVANGNFMRHIKLSPFNNEAAILTRRDKTGTRSVIGGIKGRSFGKWAIQSSLVPGSGAGVVPDADPLYEALFGQASTIVASTSVTYNLSDSIPTLSMWSFRTPSTEEQRVMYGCVVSQAEFRLGQDIAEYSMEGEGVYMLGSNYFASATTQEKAGLSAFPSEPSSPADHGNIIAGFTGSLVVDAVTLAIVRTATIKVQTGNELIKDTFGSYYPTGTIGGERHVQFAFDLYEDDSAGLETIKEAALSKAQIDAVITVGTAAGSTFTFTVKNVQLASPAYDDANLRYDLNFPDSMAHATSIATNNNEIKLAIT